MNDDVCMPVDGDDPGRLPPGPPGMPGCPKGPWRSRYEARDSFREYGKSGKFFHGSFDVKLVGLKRYSKSASTRLLCRRAGQPGRGAEPAVERRRTTKKCDCKWAVSLKARKLPEGEIFPEPTTTAPSKPPPTPLERPNANDAADVGDTVEEDDDAEREAEDGEDQDDQDVQDDLGDGTWVGLYKLNSVDPS